MSGEKVFRLGYLFTAVCVAVGLFLNILTAAQMTTLEYTQGHFFSEATRGFNQLTYFTLLSNIVVGVTSLMLAINPDRRSKLFSVARLNGLVGVVVSGIVYHLLLASKLPLQGQIASDILHTAVPLLALVMWLFFDVRGRFSWRAVFWSLAFPLCYLGFTIVRGSIINWYPYSFVDVMKYGYDHVLLNSVALTCLFLALGAVIKLADDALSEKEPPTEAQPPAAESPTDTTKPATPKKLALG